MGNNHGCILSRWRAAVLRENQNGYMARCPDKELNLRAAGRFNKRSLSVT
jgi:hypothetical protein